MMAKEYSPALLINGSLPGAGNDTLFQRGKIMLNEYGTPDLVIVQLTFPHRFLWSLVPFKKIIRIHKTENKNYIYFNHKVEDKRKLYSYINAGWTATNHGGTNWNHFYRGINGKFTKPFLKPEPIPFIELKSQRKVLEFLFLSEYFNTVIEKEVACLLHLFKNSDVKFFTWGHNELNFTPENYLGDTFDWLSIDKDNDSKYLTDSYLHFNKEGHQAVLKELMERI